MSARDISAGSGTGRFRLRLFVAMTAVVALVTGIAVYFVQREMDADLRRNLDRRFESEFDALLAVQEVSNAAVIDRCRTIVRSARIQSAIEDNGIVEDEERDLLYSIADAELQSVLPSPYAAGTAGEALDADMNRMFQARSYRFLNAAGAVIAPTERHAIAGAQEGGEGDAWLRDLAMTKLPEHEELGYLVEKSAAGGAVIHEVVATPIVSSETGQPIAALVLLFKPIELPARLMRNGVRSGIWADGHVDLPSSSAANAREVERMIGGAAGRAEGAMPVELDGAPHLLQFKKLNPGSSFHPGVLVSLFPLAESLAHFQWVRWEIIGAGALLLGGGLLASHFLSGRLSVPVEKLVIVSTTHAEQRDRAEAALDVTNEELHARNVELGNALTELKETQQRVIQQERLRALGQMASGVAHDFNNALVPILGFSELLQLSPGVLADREKAMSYINIISTAAGDAAKVVSRLRQFYRKHEDGESFHTVDVAALVTQSITLTRPRWKDQAQAGGATIRVESDLGSVPAVLGDESELREVLTNLIFNAVDAMPAGGLITVRTRSERGFAMIEVSDTGSGMTEEVRQRCLEPFFSTKGERGTGLGLSMVFGIVERHGGKVDIRSALGTGTTFIVTLALQGAQSGAEAATKNGASVTRNLSVLAVDDEAQVRDFISAALGMDGHRVEVASDGADGLRRFRDGSFDVVVTDKAMPGMTGDQMASAIKLMKPGTPVILLTGFGQFLDKSDLPGIDVLLSKPVGIQTLRAAIASALHPR